MKKRALKKMSEFLKLILKNFELIYIVSIIISIQKQNKNRFTQTNRDLMAMIRKQNASFLEKENLQKQESKVLNSFTFQKNVLAKWTLIVFIRKKT